MRGRLAVVLTAVLIAVGLAWWRFGASDDPESADGSSAAPSGGEPASFLPSSAERAEAERVVADLSVRDLAGQLIVARYAGDDAAIALVRERHIAGIIRTGSHIADGPADDPLAQVRGFHERLQRAGEERGVPVMIPVDQEGGTVARLRAPLTEFPAAMAFGAAVTGDPQVGAVVVTAAARASGAELRELGYNAVFAPVGDTTPGPDDPVIGSRSPGGDPATVRDAVLAAVEGYAEAGLIATVKHFPGHNVTEDSHFTLPVLDGSLEQLREHDLVPFAAAAEVGAPAIMTGHLAVEAVDPGIPASLSAPVVTGELRDRLGYEGLIVTDALDMAAVTQLHGAGDAAVEAIKAGNDLAVMPTDPVAAHEALVAAIEAGEIPEDQARASAARVVAAVLHAQAIEPLPGQPGSHGAAAEDLARAALTVVDQPCGDEVAFSAVQPFGNEAAVRAFEEAAREHGLATGSGPRVALVRNESMAADVVVAIDTPYLLAQSDAPIKVAVYGHEPASMGALVAWLSGDLESAGELPVEVPGLEVAGCS